MAGRAKAWESKIKPNLDKIRKLRQKGFTEKQCAEAIGIGYSTLMKHKNLHIELVEVLNKSKDELVLNLEDTLFKKALGGHTVKKTKRKWYEDENGNRTGSEVTEETSIAEPDLGALVFALTNLKPEFWKNKRDHEVKNNDVAKLSKAFMDKVVKE
jgi:hypothetical protein